MNPIKLLHNWGIKSDYLWWAGFGSIALALGTWATSMAREDDDKAQSDRWGIFVGHWVPSFFALALGLQHYEDKHFKARR